MKKKEEEKRADELLKVSDRLRDLLRNEVVEKDLNENEMFAIATDLWNSVVWQLARREIVPVEELERRVHFKMNVNIMGLFMDINKELENEEGN